MESQAKEQELVGRTIAGKYAIESYLGGGAMGAVYKARQLALDKLVAIKVLHHEHTRDETFAARFQREAKAASRLDHPNSIRVLDFGQDSDGLLYIAMELVEGRDLFRVLQQDAPLPPERIADILMQTLAAVAIAHELGVVHRDLKPENIMVLRGADDEGNPKDVVKVCDFGIAKITEPRSDEEARGAGRRLTTQGLVVGTPEYMSPEQAKGEALDARSDLYSMGIILYQLLTGRVPFDAETAIAIVLKHVTEDLVPPSEVRPEVDPRLEAICLRATQKKREDRYQSAREMRAELRAVLQGADSPASMVPSAVVAPPPEGERTPTGPRSAVEEPVVSPAELGSAATLQAFDPKRALAQAQGAERTLSKVTPGGLEALDGERPRRSAVLAVAAAGAVALVVVAAVLVVNLRARAGGDSQGATVAPAATTPPRGEPSVLGAPMSPPQVAPLPAAEPPARGEARTPSSYPSPARGRGATAIAPRASTSGPAPSAEAPSAVVPYTPIPDADAGPSVPAAGSAAPAPPGPGPDPDPRAAAPAASGAPAPSASASAPRGPFDPAKGRLDWQVRAVGGGTNARQAQTALTRFGGAWTSCYRDGLRTHGSAVVGSGLLHLETDDTGRVTAAQVSGFGALPGVMRCIEQHAPASLPVEGGAAWVNVELVFRTE